MARSHEERAAENREKADEYDAQADALESLREEILNADQIGETRLSGLFHEARTNRSDVWKAATAFLTIEGGEVVVEKVSKIREGRWSPEARQRYDATLSVPVRGFMDTDEFKMYVRDNLWQSIDGARSNAQGFRDNANNLEHLAGRGR